MILALLAHAMAAPKPKPTAPEVAAPVAPVPVQPAVPRFSKTPIGTCGCALYAPPGLVFGEPSSSEDGAQVWTGEVKQDGWTYGAVAVRFKDPFVDAKPEDLEDLLIGYLGFLQSQANITKAVGVGRGHTHSENPGARGVIDYWEDADGDRWAVKGWVDKDRLAVLFVAGKGEYPWFSAQQLYLDGFRFE